MRLEVAGHRIHGTTRQRPLELFEQEERAHLLPLPAEPWEMRQWTTAKVAPDAHCHVAKGFYSLTWRWCLIGCGLEVCMRENTVQFFLGMRSLSPTRGWRRARGRPTLRTCLPIAEPSSSAHPSGASSEPGNSGPTYWRP